MKLLQALFMAAALLASSFTMAAPAEANPAAHQKAVHDLMRAMQAEKMMRTITGQSGFRTDAQRQATFAKLKKMPAEDIYASLARASRSHISSASAIEMTRYYTSSHGKKELHKSYNSGPSLAVGGPAPIHTASERKEFSTPAYLKARKEFDQAEPMIRHEGFRLMQAIAKS
jgi:hypothetical protein